MLDCDELKKLAKQGDVEPVETTLNELYGSDLTTLPEGIALSIFESDFPETLLWREGDVIVCKITEHIYTKYWWHKYHARVFAEAMERAVRRLQHQGSLVRVTGKPVKALLRVRDIFIEGTNISRRCSRWRFNFNYICSKVG